MKDSMKFCYLQAVDMVEMVATEEAVEVNILLPN